MTELLAPAGNIEALDAAFGEGADAVYMGLKTFNARLRSSNFAWNQFEAAVQSAHRMGKKIYVTVNTVSEESETERLYRFLNYLNKIGPDGLIVQDFGVVRMCQEFCPDLELHASTQMNVESAEAANLLCREGLKRVVVARELGFEEVKHIKENTNAQIEMFVHGALCVSESGLCLFSSYLGGKSANRGMCTQACRRFYNAEIPGGFGQGYYFSPCDMQLIEKVPDLMKIGVDSFKIEGRMKSAEYVGAVTAAYRYVMDHWEQDRKGAIAEGKRILSTDFARKKSDYWYGFGSVEEGVEKAGEKILNPKQAGGTGIYLGKLSELRQASYEDRMQCAQYGKSAKGSGVLADGGDEASENLPGDEERKPADIQMALISGGDYDPDPGDSIRLHRKDDTGRESHKVRIVRTDEKNRRWIDVPTGFSTGDSVYLLQTKSMSKRYKRVLPADIGKFRRQPGPEKLPVLDLTPVDRTSLSYLPEGLYIQVSTTGDAHQVQSMHPVRVILELNSETSYDLLNKDSPEKPVLPFSKKMLIISLDPYVPEGKVEELKATLDALIQKGINTFMVNNLAHINMLRGKKVNLIAGPYLYTFNRWAVSFLENQGVMALQTPIENSQYNLEQVFEKPAERERVLVSVFAYPQLFRMRFKLPSDYDFTFFSDKEGMGFKVNSTVDGSFVMPEMPFSIVDKMDALKNKGWKRQLIDFSKTKVTKGDVRGLMNIIQKHETIPGSSRFNWKDGFFNQEKMDAYQAKAEREKALAARGQVNSRNGRGASGGKRPAGAGGRGRSRKN